MSPARLTPPSFRWSRREVPPERAGRPGPEASLARPAHLDEPGAAPPDPAREAETTPAPPPTPPREPPREPAVDRRMLEYLVCPVTHAALTYDAERQELVSRAVHLAFPIRNGIPILLISEAREID